MTATIRVPIQVRDQLVELAAARQQSLSSYITSLARREQRAAILAAARNEARDDALNPLAMDEYAAWEGTIDDGIE